MLTIARARAKFILSGEHFVVKGAPSIVMPADCFSTQVSLADQADHRVQVSCVFENDAPRISPEETREYESLVQRLLSLAAPMIGVNLNDVGLHCIVKSSIPPGLRLLYARQLLKLCSNILYQPISIQTI